jgi:surfactin synthase thioesterase subunit
VSAHLLSGETDAIVPGHSVARWAGYFEKPVTRHEIAGGHFFPFRESQDYVLDLLTRLLREAVARETQR